MIRKIELLAIGALLVTSAPAFAQGNNFFGQGSMPPGAVGALEQENATGGSRAPSPGMAAGSGTGGGDYTSDEKRMQKKYKSNLSHARGLIEKGEAMMKIAKGDTAHKDYKKGRILKEIGEKRLAELQANNPFPEPEKPVKATKGGDNKQEL